MELYNFRKEILDHAFNDLCNKEHFDYASILQRFYAKPDGAFILHTVVQAALETRFSFDTIGDNYIVKESTKENANKK